MLQSASLTKKCSFCIVKKLILCFRDYFTLKHCFDKKHKIQPKIVKKIQDHTTEIKNTGSGSIKDRLFKYETNKELQLSMVHVTKKKRQKTTISGSPLYHVKALMTDRLENRMNQ